MRQILGLVMVVILVIGYGMQDAGYEIPEEIVIVKAPSKEPRNPYQEEYEKLLYPTVKITAGYSTGSGVIFETTDKPPRNNRDFAAASQITQIITAAHVVENQSVVDIELYNAETVTGTVVITDTDKDLALLRINRDCFANARNDIIVYSARLAPGNYTYYLFTPVYAVGCSLGLSPRPSSGILSALSPTGGSSSASVVEISAPVLPGNSGGPVYDARTYEVIGIAVWVKVCQGQLVTTMAGIVPINQIYEFLDSHRGTEVTGK